MHTHFDQGTTLYIKLSSGEVIIDKFKDHKSGYVLLGSGRKVKLADVAVMTPRNLHLLARNKKEPGSKPGKRIIWRKDL